MIAALLFSSIMSISQVDEPVPSRAAASRARSVPIGGVQTIEGTIVDANGTDIVLLLRTGQYVRIDAQRAMMSHRSVTLVEQRRVVVQGLPGADAVLHALAIYSEHPDY